MFENTPFNYDLNATDPQGLDTWSLNDSSRFSIDTQGKITNTTILAVGSYGVRVTVNDTHSNTLTGTFTIYVQAVAPPPIPGFPIEAVILGAMVAVGFSVVLRRHQKKI